MVERKVSNSLGEPVAILRGGEAILEGSFQFCHKEIEYSLPLREGPSCC